MKKKILFFITAVLLSGLSGFAQTSGKCGDNLNWSYDSGVLTITGTGNMHNYHTSSYSDAPWYSFRSNITSISLTEGIASIGDYAFSNCSNIISVIIPNSVTKIGYRSFYDCTALTSLTIGISVTSIDEWAFLKCSGLTTVNFNATNCTRMGGNSANPVFEGCDALTTLNIGNNVTNIPDNVFCGCSGIASVTIPNSVTQIGNSAFRGCSGITSLIIGNSVTTIGSEAFQGCSSLKSLVIPESVTSISLYAFSGCSNITSLTIPESVTSIGSRAFSGCSGLTTIINRNSIPVKISDTVFDGVNKTSCVLKVPSGSVELYQKADEWKKFLYIVAEGTSIKTPAVDAIRIYPNPTTDIVYIGIECTIKVYNSQGALLQSTFGSQVDLSAYPKGMYLLLVNDVWVKVMKE